MDTNIIMQPLEIELITTMINKYIRKGYTRQQIYDDIFDPDDIPSVILSKKIMSVYDMIYSPTREVDPLEPEPLTWRFGQLETYTKWRELLNTLNTYWGVVIAPTGWGKSFITTIMIGAFLNRYPRQNVVYITKRKDVLQSQFNTEFTNSINWLISLGMFPSESEKSIYNMFESDGQSKFCKDIQHNRSGGKLTNSLFIYNADKLRLDSQGFNELEKQDIGLLIFDEMHWTGAAGISVTLNKLKERVPFAIGFSATPVRAIPENQMRTFNLFGNGTELNILNEITYMDGWQHKFILPVKHFYFPIDKQELIDDVVAVSGIKPPESDAKITYKISTAGHKSMLLALSDEIWTDKLHFKKAIMYFETRNRLVDFYCKVQSGVFNDTPMISDCLSSQGGIFMSFSYQSSNAEDCQLLAGLDAYGMTLHGIDTGIEQFKQHPQNALLMVVGRAVEGFDDYRVEVVINMDYVETRNPLTTLQKIGRAQRIPKDEDPSVKPFGYYVCPVKKTDGKQELCGYIAKLANDYLSVIGSDLLDDPLDIADAEIDIDISGLNIRGSSQEPVLPVTKIKSIIEQNLYLSAGYEITADDILQEIRTLNFREIRSSGRLARFCQEHNIRTILDYNRFRDENKNRFNLRISPFDYPGFGWKLVIDPSGVIHYPTKEICMARASAAEQDFRSKFVNYPDNPEYRELAKLRKYTKNKFLNQLDPKIPNMSFDDYYGKSV